MSALHYTNAINSKSITHFDMTIEKVREMIYLGYNEYRLKFPNSTLTFEQYQELAVQAIELIQLKLQAENN